MAIEEAKRLIQLRTLLNGDQAALRVMVDGGTEVVALLDLGLIETMRADLAKAEAWLKNEHAT